LIAVQGHTHKTKKTGTQKHTKKNKQEFVRKETTSEGGGKNSPRNLQAGEETEMLASSYKKNTEGRVSRENEM